MKWWEKAFIDLGNGIQDFGNGVVKGVETVVESTVDGVVSFAEFVKDFVTDPIGTTANVLSAMWDTIKDPKFWALATTSVVVGLGVASCGSIPVGILVTCIATSAVGEAYDLCIVHRFNLDSFFASRGCKTFMEYIGKQIVVIGADGLKAYLSGKVIERFTKGKGSSTNKLPDNDLIEDSVQDAIEDGVSSGGHTNTSKPNSSSNNIANGVGNVQIPDKAKDIANQVKAKNGAPPQGYKGGKVYQNQPKGNAQKLPEGINYKEYDINPYVKGQNRGTERIVIGDDGSVWYTNDHYKTFTKLE